MLTRDLAEKGLPRCNTNIAENYFKNMCSQEEINELSEKSEEIFKKNMLDRYMDKPDEKSQNGKFASVNYLYYAELLRY